MVQSFGGRVRMGNHGHKVRSGREGIVACMTGRRDSEPKFSAFYLFG